MYHSGIRSIEVMVIVIPRRKAEEGDEADYGGSSFKGSTVPNGLLSWLLEGGGSADREVIVSLLKEYFSL